MEVNAAGMVITPQSFRVKELESSGLLWTSYEADVFNQISENVSGEDKSYNASNSNEIIVLNSLPEHSILLAKIARPMATTLRIYRTDSDYLNKVESKVKKPIHWRRFALFNARNHQKVLVISQLRRLTSAIRSLSKNKSFCTKQL